MVAAQGAMTCASALTIVFPNAKAFKLHTEMLFFWVSAHQINFSSPCTILHRPSKPHYPSNLLHTGTKLQKLLWLKLHASAEGRMPPARAVRTKEGTYEYKGRKTESVLVVEVAAGPLASSHCMPSVKFPPKMS